MQWLDKYPALMRHSRLVVMMALASGLMLAAALFGQFVLGWHPCELCLYQRYPYMAIIGLAAIGLFFRGRLKVQKALVLLGVVMFLATAGIAAYHTGVELKWIEGPSACSGGDTTGMTLEELRQQIMQAPLVSCDQAMAYIFGLSLAAWNMITAFTFAMLSLWLFRHINKKHAL